MTEPAPLTTTEICPNVSPIVQEFLKDLEKFDDPQMVQRHIAYGPCVHLDSEAYYRLKRLLSEKWKIHHSEVIVVGSAKLGFSISPKKRYKLFNDDSDIDVAIISSVLFDEFWKSAYSYASDPANLWDRKADFIKYIFKGWVRPDMLPPGDRFPLKSEWTQFFDGLTTSREFGSYQIVAGIYRDWQFFEKYQQGGIAHCRNEE